MSERSIVELCIEDNYITPQTPNFHLIKIALEQPDQGMQFTVRSAKDLCQEAAKNDPLLFAARALGLEPDHPFLQISTSLPERLELDDGMDFLEMLEYEGILDSNTAEPEPVEYEWTANMSELFSGNEVPMDLNVINENTESNVIDVSDPLVLDNTLVESGAAPALFHEGRESKHPPPCSSNHKLTPCLGDESLPEDFNFWESF